MQVPALNPKSVARKHLLRDLNVLIRKETRTATLFVRTVAESVGIHQTDLKCLDFLAAVHSATAGDLARTTGLTTGAITAVIDRMEKAGFIKRTADKQDRRKTIIQLITKHPRHLRLVHNLFSRRIPNLLSKYTDSELRLIIDWNVKMIDIFHEEVRVLKTAKRNKKTCKLK